MIDNMEERPFSAVQALTGAPLSSVGRSTNWLWTTSAGSCSDA